MTAQTKQKFKQNKMSSIKINDSLSKIKEQFEQNRITVQTKYNGNSNTI